jgi:hypothetical protein
MFQPPLSWSMTRVCCPAGSVTVAVTVVQVCQPPVAGTLTLHEGVQQTSGVCKDSFYEGLEGVIRPG